MPIALGGACVALGLAGMLGVVTRSPALVQLVRGTTPIRFNTAVCFVVAGAGVVAAAVGRRAVVLVSAAVLATIGGLTALEYLFSVDLRIDELIVRDFRLTPDQLPRMAPNTAVAFLVAALALGLIGIGRQRRWMPTTVGLAGMFVGSVGFVALVGYLLGMSTAYRWGDAEAIAVGTSAGLVLLSGGLIERAWRGSTAIEEGIPRWLPWAIGIGVVVTNFALVESLANVKLLEGGAIRDVGGVREVLLGIAVVSAGLLGLATHFALVARRRAILLSRDIAVRTRAEEALRIERDRFQCLVDANIVGIGISDGTGRVFTANDYYLEVIGHTREELEAGEVNWRAVTPPEWLAADERSLREIRERGACVPFEKEYVRRDGSRIPVLIADALLPGPEERFAGFVLDMTEQRRSKELLRRSEQRLVGAHEEERRRIASDIHDDPVQKMTAVGIQLDVLCRRIAEPEAQEALDALGELVRLSIGRLRQLLFELRPPAVERGGLADAIRRLGEDLGEAGVELRVEDRLAAEPSSETSVNAYRIVQEALANIRKHARASRAAVTLETREGSVWIHVEDDGVGITLERLADPVLGHIGIDGMRERAQLAGGWCTIHGSPGEGTTVECLLPGDATTPALAPTSEIPASGDGRLASAVSGARSLGEVHL